MTTKTTRQTSELQVDVADAHLEGAVRARPQPVRLGSALRRSAVTVVGSLIAMVALAAEPIEIIVPFGLTSGADTLARYCAPALQSALATPVHVKNVPGSTGNQGIARLLAAPSDGRTVAVLTGDTYSTLAYSNPPWKSSDVIPVAIMMRQPSMLFVLASSRFAKWQDLEKEARARPRALRVAISGFGSPDYIELQQLALKNIILTPVPRLSPKDKYQALIDGEADALYEQMGDVRSFVEAKQMRPILIFNRAQPGITNGGVPTSGELGLGNGLEQFRAFVVKAGTSPQAVAALASAFEQIGTSSDFKSFLEKQVAASDSFVAVKGARTFMERDFARMKQVVDGLPMHAQHLFDDKHTGELPVGF